MAHELQRGREYENEKEKRSTLLSYANVALLSASLEASNTSIACLGALSSEHH